MNGKRKMENSLLFVGFLVFGLWSLLVVSLVFDFI